MSLTPKPLTKTLEALAFIRMFGGSNAATVAVVIGVSHPTASTMLARLYWRGHINRSKTGPYFTYTPRS